MSIKAEVPSRIENNPLALEWFADLYQRTKSLMFESIIIDFSNTTWFDAQYSACLGAILSEAENEINDVKIKNLSQPIETILRKNQFLTNYGFDALADRNDTTIPFRKFARAQEKNFKSYIDNDLLSKQDLPSMSDKLKKRISESVIEIFINAYTHGNSSNVFCCGQYYPAKKLLDFSLVNIGSTFRENVSAFLDKEMNSIQAIQWAVEEGNTTRTGAVPGGLGLSTIRSFIELNNGKIQIFSGQGVWEQRGGAVTTRRTQKKFGGTIVSVEFNIDDANSYVLSSEETSAADIF